MSDKNDARHLTMAVQDTLPMMRELPDALSILASLVEAREKEPTMLGFAEQVYPLIHMANQLLRRAGWPTVP